LSATDAGGYDGGFAAQESREALPAIALRNPLGGIRLVLFTEEECN
jgi:hypothetical protein